jgi:Uma2 family endonuclease
MNAPISPPQFMTAEEFLALPDDGVERWLIRGRLRERRPETQEMTYRNQTHSTVEANVVYALKHWLQQQPRPRGRICSGEAGCRLRQTPDSVVGIDVVYISAELAARRTAGTTLIDGAPILAVEILSPNDTQEDIHEKIDDYLAAGVALVWIMDTHRETVTVYRPDTNPAMFNASHELTAEPHLPGFKVPVAELFAD